MYYPDLSHTPNHSTPGQSARGSNHPITPPRSKSDVCASHISWVCRRTQRDDVRVQHRWRMHSSPLKSPLSAGARPFRQKGLRDVLGSGTLVQATYAIGMLGWEGEGKDETWALTTMPAGSLGWACALRKVMHEGREEGDKLVMAEGVCVTVCCTVAEVG